MFCGVRDTDNFSHFPIELEPRNTLGPDMPSLGAEPSNMTGFGVSNPKSRFLTQLVEGRQSLFQALLVICWCPT